MLALLSFAPLQQTSTRALLTAATALTLSSLAACGRGPDVAGSRLASESTAASLAGTWAKQMVFSSESSALGVTTRSKVERLLLVRATADGGLVSTTEDYCDVIPVSSRNATVSFPEALKRVLPQRRQTFTVRDEAGQVRLGAPATVEVLGARLADVSEPLPRSADDPRVFDQDLDGQPGVSFEVRGRVVLVNINARLYLTQRTVVEESGVLQDAETIKGSLRWSLDQYTLGSDSSLLSRISPTITARVDESEFTMRKLSDDATCATLTERYAELFTRPTL